jgi:hypothetical protein
MPFVWESTQWVPPWNTDDLLFFKTFVSENAFLPLCALLPTPPQHHPPCPACSLLCFQSTLPVVEWPLWYPASFPMHWRARNVFKYLPPLQAIQWNFLYKSPTVLTWGEEPKRRLLPRLCGGFHVDTLCWTLSSSCPCLTALPVSTTARAFLIRPFLGVHGRLVEGPLEKPQYVDA